MQNILEQYYNIIRLFTNCPNELLIFIYYIVDRRIAVLSMLIRCLVIPPVGMLKSWWMVTIDPLLKNSRSDFSFPSTHTVSISMPYFGLAIGLKRWGAVLYMLYPIFIISICGSYEFFHFHSHYDVLAGAGISLIGYVLIQISHQLVKKDRVLGYVVIVFTILLSYSLLFLVGDCKILQKYHIIMFISIVFMTCTLGAAGTFDKDLPKGLIARFPSLFIALALFKLLSFTQLLGISSWSIELLKGLLLPFVIFVLPDMLVSTVFGKLRSSSG
ncbi:hypothetical protein Cyrtocomes_00489 [Candidatus Cyrtobacter comes]|uniref:Phosphatidic acid phosphatase type 2/haloperoxidase domain-containing protein n=1 Tax=Candidatus Cyrtobacter comes TaxID=675776 RepID=A0ABU5L7M0_9RICK|nr:hypothetical protein [Candidatus Cyrtobacter comes]MDZ5762120.1 hypothetical protein [Candidatus Cyrtobacter comes]